MKYVWRSCWILLGLIGSLSLARGQAFPIEIDANGETVINSMDVDPLGNIYVTGEIENFTQFNFGPGCGVGASDFEPTNFNRMFVAKLDPVTYDLVWLVASNTIPVDDRISSNDIEVAADGSAYFTGTTYGNFVLSRLVGGAPAPLIACGGNLRHFVARIAPDGTPDWVCETQAPGVMQSHGEGIILDEANNRLFTGGWIETSGITGTASFRNSNCLGGCSFTADMGTSPSTEVGFVAEYTFTGTCLEAKQVGERVMALDMDRYDPILLWATGSKHDLGSPDRDVLLAAMQVDPLDVPCDRIDLAFIAPTAGVGGDIGLDIAASWDNRVVLIGSFTTAAWFPPDLVTTVAPGNSDHFIASWDNVASQFDAIKTSDLPSPVTENADPYLERHSCIGVDDESSAKVIVAFDKDVISPGGLTAVNGRIITWDLQADLTPFNWTQFGATLPPPFPGSPYQTRAQARPMEIVYDPASNDKFLAGDHGAELDIWGCILDDVAGENKNGYVGRINIDHTFFYRMDVGEEEEASLPVLSPNPANEQINIHIEGAEEGPLEVTVVDLQGRLVLQESTNRSNLTISTKTLPQGLYLVRIQSEGSTHIEKLVIEH